MRKEIIYATLVVVALCAIAGLYNWTTYNSFVSKQVDAAQATSDLSTEFQRRGDLIPNMMKSAEASFKFQIKLTTGYAEAREGLSAANQTYQEAIKHPNDTASVNKAIQALDDAKQSWNVIVSSRSESVPQANLDQISELNNEMAALENVIAKKRQDYNKVVGDYNRMIMTFPSSWVASRYGFTEMEFFKAQPGTENAPIVNINI
jgi:LemA protein